MQMGRQKYAAIMPIEKNWIKFNNNMLNCLQKYDKL
jgi:hypothetical protein